jgi:hypothetical protein
VPFADLVAARRWVARLVVWYNSEHRHSAIRFVAPAERHSGADVAILGRRHELYERARRRPERWTRNTRNSTPIMMVVLNPTADQPRAACRMLTRSDNYLDAHRELFSLPIVALRPVNANKEPT